MRYLKNMNSSPMTLSNPRWQTEIINRIAEQYADRFDETNRKFYEGLSEIMGRAKPEYVFGAVNKLMRTTPRFCYEKNFSAPYGHVYDIEIDLLGATVYFNEIDE